jgi:hypothetical protein
MRLFGNPAKEIFSQIPNPFQIAKISGGSAADAFVLELASV